MVWFPARPQSHMTPWSKEDARATSAAPHLPAKDCLRKSFVEAQFLAGGARTPHKDLVHSGKGESRGQHDFDRHRSQQGNQKHG